MLSQSPWLFAPPSREIEITRPEKALFPEDGITKGDLIGYYAGIAPWMLPHLRNRPSR